MSESTSDDLIAGLVIEFSRLQQSFPKRPDRSTDIGLDVLIREYLARLNCLLGHYNVEIRNHTGQTWLNGYPMTVVHTRDGTIEPVIVETIRPSIVLNDRIISQGFVVLGNKTELEQSK